MGNKRWFEPRWMKHIRDIEKHLGKNEHWFEKPEKHLQEFEKEMTDWNEQFLNGMGEVDKAIKKLEDKVEEK